MAVLAYCAFFRMTSLRRTKGVKDRLAAVHFAATFAQRLLNPLRRSGCICYGGYRHRRAGIHACLGCRGSSMGLHPIRGERGERLRGSLPAKISWRRHDVGGGRGLTGRAGGKGPDVGATGAEVRKAGVRGSGVGKGSAIGTSHLRNPR